MRTVAPAVTTLAGMVGAVALVALIAPAQGPLVLAAVLAMTLARSRLVRSWRGRLEGLIGLPVVALAVAGVGLLLREVPPVGAALFTLGVASAVWLRRYGERGRRIGSVVSLPFVSLLITPVDPRTTPLPIVIAVSLLAFAVVVLVRIVAVRLGVLPRDEDAQREAGAASPSSLRPSASTRMAVQLALALALAWTAGLLLFPQHATWVALSAYLVQSGTRGRLDVLHKSGLRVLGAAVGTLVASGLALLPHLDGGVPLTLLVLALVGAGLVLRQASYAWWAAAVTIVTTLLQEATTDAAPQPVPRLAAILLGAAISLAAAWFVLPVRSLGVLRRRIADALAALDAWLAAPEPAAAERAALDAALARVLEVAAPFRHGRRLRRIRASFAEPGDWIALTTGLVEAAVALPDDARARARRPVGVARRSVRDPDRLAGALAEAGAAVRAAGQD